MLSFQDTRQMYGAPNIPARQNRAAG